MHDLAKGYAPSCYEYLGVLAFEEFRQSYLQDGVIDEEGPSWSQLPAFSRRAWIRSALACYSRGTARARAPRKN